MLPERDRTLHRWFNRAALQAAPFAFGNAGVYPNIQGPGLASVDFSLKRYVRLSLTEKSRIEMRGECFNCFNRANLNEPVGTLSSGSFGRVTSALAARALQVALEFWF